MPYKLEEKVLPLPYSTKLLTTKLYMHPHTCMHAPVCNNSHAILTYPPSPSDWILVGFLHLVDEVGVQSKYPGRLAIMTYFLILHMHTHAHTCMQTHTYTFACKHTHTHMHANTHIHICMQTHTYTYACKHTHTHANKHTHTHTCMQTHT